MYEFWLHSPTQSANYQKTASISVVSIGFFINSNLPKTLEKKLALLKPKKWVERLKTIIKQSVFRVSQENFLAIFGASVLQPTCNAGVRQNKLNLDLELIKKPIPVTKNGEIKTEMETNRKETNNSKFFFNLENKFT